MTLEQAEFVRSALKSVERYGNVFLHERYEVSPYAKVVDALAIMDNVIAEEKIMGELLDREEAQWE